MPLPTLTLDDRSYADLVEEARKRIPALCPGWTDHNPTDPGIVLIEMLAWLTEMLIYRVDQVTDDSRRAFLRLLTGKEEKDAFSEQQGEALDTLLANAVNELRTPYRAVTKEDYELLAREEADPDVARALCLPGYYVDDSIVTELPGYVGVIVVPKNGSDVNPDKIKKIEEFFDDRRLLTTRVRVSGPHYLEVQITVTVVALPDHRTAVLQGTIEKAIKIFYSPLPCTDVVETKSGVIENKTGWSFGRSLYASELYALLDRLPGVDYVTEVSIERAEGVANGPRASEEGRTEKSVVLLQPYQLPKLNPENPIVNVAPADRKQLPTDASKAKVIEP